MIRLSVSEFKKMCESIGAKSFIYAPEMQKWDEEEDVVNIKMTFDSVEIHPNPDVICFRNESGLMCLYQIGYIMYDDCMINKSFRILCGGKTPGGYSKEYTFYIK